MRNSISLNGLWEWHIPGGLNESVRVPSCYHCVGDSFYEKDIEMEPPLSGRTILRFEGIHYEGNLWFNGQDLGELLPYTRFEFDISSLITSGTNHITVLVRDITAEFGPTSGWENYGGISRDVYLDYYPDAYIADTHWITYFRDSYKTADCQLKLYVDQPGNIEFEGEVSYALSYEDNIYLKGSAPVFVKPGETISELTFTANSPLLWDCDMPNLYKLTISLKKNGIMIDERSESVGFREFKAEGTRFLLNGKDTPLKGVCRHEMWGEHQGFTLTKEQIEYDFRLIKQMGANYVRLVHYPHCAYTLEVCDKLGIMVSEEPGLWWSDFRQGRMAEKAIDIMTRTVKRDRNRPSVIFWLLFNECLFAGNYPSDARKVCRSLDPTRLVSAANCMSISETKEYFEDQELDFYTYHAYGHQTNLISDMKLSLDEVCTVLDEKPLVITEWGGWYIHNNQNLIDQFKEAIARLSHNRSPLPNLAGIAWWQWQDIYEYYRGLPACIDGVLCDGLVDANRNVKPMYQQMAGIFREIDNPAKRICNLELIEPNQQFNGEILKPVCLQSILDIPEQVSAWEYAAEHPNRTDRAGHKKYNKQHAGPIMPYALSSIGRFPVDIKKGRPVIFSDRFPQAELPINDYVFAFTIIGQVTYCEGYPAVGQYGDQVMRYELVFDDGEIETFVLKNGVDFSSSSLLSDSSRMNPMANRTGRVMRIDWERNWEIYQVSLEVFPVNPAKKLTSIRFILDKKEEIPFSPLLYGVTIEKAR